MADNDSKTEKATSKKRKDERKKGNIFTSKDVVTVVSTFAVFGCLKILFPFIYENLSAFFRVTMEELANVDEITISLAMKIAVDCMRVIAVTAVPLLLVSMVSTVIATGSQTKFLFAAESLKPKFNRLNPLSGIKRMFSLRSVIELIKSMLKLIIVCAVAVNFVKDQISIFTRMPFMGLMQSIIFTLNCIIDLVFRLCAVFLFIAALDYLYQWWDYERQLKMTKHEIKEEYKQMEGDPQIKGRIRDLQRKFAMSRMMQEVPTADVIIKNPTHFAVALRYNIERDNAPIVVAKGQDHVALRIIAIGEENSIYITENKPLARALYETAELNREIPMDYYNAVAEVLAALYQMKLNQRGN